MGKTHFVTIAAPKVGSRLYLLQGRSSAGYTPFQLVAICDGAPAMVETQYSFESLVQGHERDMFGNTSVDHSYAVGSVYAIPKTSSELRIEKYDYSARNQNSYTGYQWYLGTRLIHTDIVKSWYPQNDDVTTYITNCNVRSFDSMSICYGKPYKEAFGSTRFMVNYEQIFNSRYESSVTVTQHVNPQGGSESGGTSTNIFQGWCDVIDLGTVLSSYSNTEYLRPTSLNAVETPETLLVDLYKKIGTPQVNNCENISQLKKWKEMVPPIKDLILKHDIKSVANLYLWWKYSFSTTKMDVEAYFNWFKTLSQQKANIDNTCHYSLTYNLASNDVLRYNIYTSPYSIGVIEALGLDINLSNTWDMLPFSFIVDWFISIGDSLHSIDVANLDSKLDVRSFVQSRKTKRMCPKIYEANVIGQVTWSTYSRVVGTQLPSTVCAVHFNNPSSHLLDATSLIVANKK